jgi:DNA helicase II / ATP-dependent DNA helicase PcrA
MTIASLLSDLNEHQRIAASMPNQHTLVLAGAGCGKTKTIVARAAFLISSGTPAHRIQILTFTRRSASEIVERVRMQLGDVAEGLRASTFHTWCISLIRKAPSAFGYKDYSLIDRDDQLQLFKVLRGNKNSAPLPTASELCDLYSFARNTRQTLDATLQKNAPEAYGQKEQIAQVMLSYESRKRDRRYLDYDDILDVVAQRLASSPETCSWVANQYDHLLIDEMQDTNPLQWKLIDPLKNEVTLFCVGDDAQSIYGFRGADFRNVHSFGDRVIDSVTLKLEKNYRSTQEILDISNWLLSESPLNYGKILVASRGSGKRPQINTFASEWEEGRWITDDLIARRGAGADWKEHMILVRSSFAARIVESALLAKEIPYRFVGGTKLLESAHIRDILSALRLVANPQDEIGWMRFLTLWNGVGEITASQVMEKILQETSLDGCIKAIEAEAKIPELAANVVRVVEEFQNQVSKAISNIVKLMEEMLSVKYKNQDWEKRKRDFGLVEKLAEKHTSIFEFIEEYLLDPVHSSQVERLETDDVVTVITIHSAKGTECEVCYVVNVSPGAFPSARAIGNENEVEEERRVLYVALTRAKNELIITRQGYQLWSVENANPQTDTPNAMNAETISTPLLRVDGSSSHGSWEDVLIKASPQLKAFLREAEPNIGDGVLVLTYGAEHYWHANKVLRKLEEIGDIVKNVFGDHFVLELILPDGSKKTWNNDPTLTTSPTSTMAAAPRGLDIKTPRIADAASYFFNNIPDGILDNHIHKREHHKLTTNAPEVTQPLNVGIEIG